MHAEVLASLSLPALLACADSPGKLPRDEPGTAPGTTEGASALASFERMLRAEWRWTPESEAWQVDTWSEGPGGRSFVYETRSTAGDGGPWHELLALYRYPHRQQVRRLGPVPQGWRVAEGRFRFEGDTIRARYDLDPRGERRAMDLMWSFVGPDRYVETLREIGAEILGR